MQALECASQACALFRGSHAPALIADCWMSNPAQYAGLGKSGSPAL